MRQIDPCEYFRVGDVWMSPRGTLYRVEDRCGPWLATAALRAVVPEGKGRLVKRRWYDVTGWVRPPELNQWENQP